MAQGSYQLELEQPKRNVFVTQLHERDEEEDDIRQYPIVKENAGKLLETGINTLQRTLLLRKEVEVDTVNGELQSKREEFRQRMETCGDRQVDTQKKQQEMRDRVNKFEKFIKENEAKRRRAIQKYQMEVKLKEQKDREHEMLLIQLEELRARHDYLKRKLQKYEKFKNYLLQVLDILPDHYLEEGDSMLNSLMMRHSTLSDTNHGLVLNLEHMADEVERLKAELEEMRYSHNKMKLSINAELSQMQKQQEVSLGRNDEGEEQYTREKILLRNRRCEFGQIEMAINNLAEKCKRHMDPPTDPMTLFEKLEIVKSYVKDKSDVAKMAAPGGASSPSLERKSPRPIDRHRPKKTVRLVEANES